MLWLLLVTAVAMTVTTTEPGRGALLSGWAAWIRFIFYPVYLVTKCHCS